MIPGKTSEDLHQKEITLTKSYHNYVNNKCNYHGMVYTVLLIQSHRLWSALTKFSILILLLKFRWHE